MTYPRFLVPINSLAYKGSLLIGQVFTTSTIRSINLPSKARFLTSYFSIHNYPKFLKVPLQVLAWLAGGSIGVYAAIFYMKDIITYTIR